jgi:hypothetical protein
MALRKPFVVLAPLLGQVQLVDYVFKKADKPQGKQESSSLKRESPAVDEQRVEEHGVTGPHAEVAAENTGWRRPRAKSIAKSSIKKQQILLEKSKNTPYTLGHVSFLPSLAP